MEFFYASSCTVREGKIKIFNREALEKELYRWPDGLDLEFILQEPKRQRTNAQNRFLHGPVCSAFRELGWSDQDTKIELCLRFLPVEHTRPDGAVVIVPGHTSTLTVEEFNRFLDQVIQFAAEHDVYIEDSDKWRALHPAGSTA
jgi:hypothetical protein